MWPRGHRLLDMGLPDGPIFLFPQLCSTGLSGSEAWQRVGGMLGCLFWSRAQPGAGGQQARPGVVGRGVAAPAVVQEAAPPCSGAHRAFPSRENTVRHALPCSSPPCQGDTPAASGDQELLRQRCACVCARTHTCVGACLSVRALHPPCNACYRRAHTWEKHSRMYRYVIENVAAYWHSEVY